MEGDGAYNMEEIRELIFGDLKMISGAFPLLVLSYDVVT